AVVIFTGSKDEIFTGSPKACSTKSVSDVINLATSRAGRTPIYTIGMRGFQAIAEADLLTMSDQTGGTSALGKDPGPLFGEISGALNAQFVAEALVSAKQGDRNFGLRLTVGGTNPNDATGHFTSPKDYSVKPTA